jgi:hypothetical protein
MRPQDGGAALNGQKLLIIGGGIEDFAKVFGMRHFPAFILRSECALDGIFNGWNTGLFS